MIGTTILQVFGSRMNSVAEVVVAIPTADRPSVLTGTVNSLLSQSHVPARIIIVANARSDVEESIRQNPQVTVLLDAGSLTHKRNTALRHATCKYVFFADDDIELHPAYISEAVLLLEDFPGVIGLSGKLLRDGGVSREKAKELIGTADER